MALSTTTKILIGAGVLGVGYLVVKQLAPQPKNGVSQVVDSFTDFLKAWKSDGSQSTATIAHEQGQPYSSGTAFPDTKGIARNRPSLAPTNTATRAQAALILGIN